MLSLPRPPHALLPSPHALGSLSESRSPLDSATDKLRHDYNILLANEGLRWSSEFTFRLLETLEAIPQLSTRSYYAVLDEQAIPPSKWILAEKHIADDIAIAINGTARTVRISSHAFVHATPQVVRLDGERGRFFSRRLHHALVRFVTNHGADTQAVQHVMSNRYGCTTLMSDALYVSLTAPTTAEDEASFQPFETHVEEPLLLLNMLEELPAGLHVVPGLAYLLRRKDGYDHPLYPTAAAVAWPTAHEQSYVEFMESGMVGDLRHTRRLILHEKAHFMWANLFSAGLRADWVNISGWYEDANATSGWVTTQQTTFVSAYAHAHNPNEDMAESVSYYVENPAWLQACCPEKYQFIRDRVMHGYRYVSRVRPDLTFQVLNLFPDYTYPGKIVYVSITVEGEPEESKTCTVEIRLHVLDGVFEGAQHALFRLFSEIGTYQDVYLYPVDATNSSVLSNSFVLSKYAKVSHPNPSPVATRSAPDATVVNVAMQAGFWRPQQIVLKVSSLGLIPPPAPSRLVLNCFSRPPVQDLAGNQRFAGMNDFGWRLHVDNPLEDVGPPAYVEGSLMLSVTESTLEGHAVHYVTVSWLLTEDRGMDQWGGVFVRLINDAAGSGTRGLEEYGYPGLTPAGNACGAALPSETHLCERATIELLITPYRASANYSASRIRMLDVAQNERSLYFGSGADMQPAVWVRVTNNAAEVDDEPPELDLNNISVSAEPTNPNAPNGETRVTISYWARDDKSGLGLVWYRLLDPQGGSHFEYHYHENFYTTFFAGNASAWSFYVISVVLPPGSAPGTWGLESLELTDKVDNNQGYSFVENVHFELLGRRRLGDGSGARALPARVGPRHPGRSPVQYYEYLRPEALRASQRFAVRVL